MLYCLAAQYSSFDDVAPAEEAAPAEDSATAAGDSVGLEELGNLDFDSMPADNFDEDAGDAAEAAPAAEGDDLDNGGIPDGLFDAGDFDLGDAGEAAASTEFSAEDEIPDFDDTAGLDGEDAGDGTTEENAPLEVFDTSEMDGMDFGIQDTDSQISGNAAGDFEFGSHEDFAMEGEFEIPGFSDVATAKEEKSKTKLVTGKEPKGKKAKGKGKAKELDEPDFSEAQESEELPPNTLSDEQYKVFLANLAEYPLNVRLAFEDFIVQDEFTDDAEFEIIEKIL